MLNDSRTNDSQQPEEDAKPVSDDAQPAAAGAEGQGEDLADGESSMAPADEKHSSLPKRPRLKKPTRPEPAVEEEPGSDSTGEFLWYVLRVQSGREDTVSNNLRKKLVLHGFQELVRDVAVPKQKVTEIKDGKKRVRAQKVFPGYIFVEMDLTDGLWYLIRDTS